TRPALILEPGLAFGTGQHPTTRFLLDWLAMHPPVGKTVIDWGCGSGILGLAALLLGAKSCLGTDTDPQAWAASRANARLNNVTFPVYPPDQLPESKVDLILANILARPLMQLKSRFDAHLLPGGTLLLTGILASQIPAMEKTYAPDYTLTVETREKDWVLLTAIRQT
ncbi:MAG: 50S ribosomal protein L11 methyltransferase, partial [Candidatus Neomarinimicrobiota bacterium]